MNGAFRLGAVLAITTLAVLAIHRSGNSDRSLRRPITSAPDSFVETTWPDSTAAQAADEQVDEHTIEEEPGRLTPIASRAALDGQAPLVVGSAPQSAPAKSSTLVHFTIDCSATEQSVGFVWVSEADAPDAEPLRVAVTGNEGSQSFPSGSYVAAARSQALGFGPIQRFEVSDQEQTVQISAPYGFDLIVPVVDATTTEVIVGARMQVSRADLPSAWSQPAVEASISDNAGEAHLEQMTPGRWRLVGQAEGYVDDETTFDYPGRQAKRAREEGFVRLEAFYLPPARPVHFQLVNHESWNDLTEFSVALTHTGFPVEFSPDGAATIELGWYEYPLYIKLDYPGMRSSIRYLDGGLPEVDEVHEIDLGGSQELEVDLQITQQMLELLETRSGLVAVSFRGANEDAIKTAIDIGEPATLVFNDVQARHVIVSFETFETGTPLDWSSVRVEMKPEGRTSCTLVVDAPPIQLRVVDSMGSPVLGFHCEIRQLPDDTTWLTGGSSDAEGLVPVGRVVNGECSLCGVRESDFTVAIDVPIDLTLPQSVIEFSIAPSAPDVR